MTASGLDSEETDAETNAETTTYYIEDKNMNSNTPIIAVDMGNSIRNTVKETDGKLVFAIASSGTAQRQTHEAKAKAENLEAYAAAHPDSRVVGLRSNGNQVKGVETFAECAVVLAQVEHFPGLKEASLLIDLGGGTTHAYQVRGAGSDWVTHSLSQTGVLDVLRGIVKRDDFAADCKTKNGMRLTHTQLGVVLANLGEKTAVVGGRLVFGDDLIVIRNWSKVYAPAIRKALTEHLTLVVERVEQSLADQAGFGEESGWDPKNTYLIGGGAALLVALGCKTVAGINLYGPAKAAHFANCYAAYKAAGGELVWELDVAEEEETPAQPQTKSQPIKSKPTPKRNKRPEKQELTAAVVLESAEE